MSVFDMPIIRVFPYTIAGMEIIAAAIYLYHREWRLAIVWLGVGIANAAFAGIK